MLLIISKFDGCTLELLKLKWYPDKVHVLRIFSVGWYKINWWAGGNCKSGHFMRNRE